MDSCVAPARSNWPLPFFLFWQNCTLPIFSFVPIMSGQEAQSCEILTYDEASSVAQLLSSMKITRFAFQVLETSNADAMSHVFMLTNGGASPWERGRRPPLLQHLPGLPHLKLMSLLHLVHTLRSIWLVLVLKTRRSATSAAPHCAGSFGMSWS